MTIGNAIALTDELVGNQVDGPVKVLWLSNLDLRVAELLRTREGSFPPFSGYDGDTPMSTALKIPPPYDEVYRWYLELKLWDAAGEIARYNNAAAKFNGAWQDYKDYVNRTTRPLKVQGLKLV